MKCPECGKQMEEYIDYEEQSMWCPEARGGCGNDLGIKDLVKIIDKLEKELAHIRLMYMDRAAGWCGLAQNPADDNSK